MLLMTTEKLELPGKEEDLKKYATVEFIRSILIRSCAMFGFVTARSMTSNKTGMAVEGGSLDLLVDTSKASFLSMEERVYSYTKMYVY